MDGRVQAEVRRSAAFPPLVQAMRPRQWVKNLLVFAAPAAAGVLSDAEALGRASLTFVAFGLVASGIYLVNDIADVESDRVHVRKRHRPIAAGQVSIPVAGAAAAILLVAGIAVGWSIDFSVAALLAVYALLSGSYSAGLKSVPVVEMLIVASGFVLRAAAGAAAVGVPASQWFLTVMAFGALAIAAGKRGSELARVGSDTSSRRVLSEYTPQFIAQVETMAVGGALVGYALWAFDVALEARASILIEMSVVPVAVALLRYLLIVSKGDAEAPEEAVFAEPVVVIAGLVWAVLFLFGIGW